MDFFTEEERENLLIEYEELHNEILQRNHYTWLIISILLAGSFLISFGTNNPTLIHYSVSIFLTILSWASQEYFVSVNRSCWKRREEIEQSLKMYGQKRRYEHLKSRLIYKIGMQVWRILFIGLMIAYITLIGLYVLSNLTMA
jgi:hypothetical protein